VPRRMSFIIACCAALILLAAAGPVRAQSIQATISSDEAFVGEAVQVQVTVSNMSQAVEPTPPETKDFEITRTGSVASNSQMQIINGRMKQSVSYTYTFDVRPLRTGRLTLPPFSAQSGGRVYHSQQFPINVVQDTAGNEVICEIKTPAETAYVGQAVTLTLEVWIQKFSQPGIGSLDAQTMWNPALRNMPASSLGVFTGADADHVKYAERKRLDETGTEQAYIVYVIETTAYPTTPGQFDFGEVAFAYNYPVRIGRDFFNLRLERTRRLRVPAKKPQLVIKALPQEGRPADFNGAIGAYSIRAWAKPTDVPVGDPITLNLEIKGNGPLERLSAPRLDQVAALTHDFEISGESPAGTVEGDRKKFTVTIRALREDVSRIPPIPMSYFNIETGAYDTAWSEPIPITIRPAQRLLLPALPASGEQTGVINPLTETTEGLLANEDRPDLILADQGGSLGAAECIVLVFMPAAYLATWFIQRRAVRFRDDATYRRRTRAYATARKALRDAPASGAAAVRGALIGYVADRCGVPSGGLTRVEAVDLLTARKALAQTVQAIDGLLEKLELVQYSGIAAAEDVTRAADDAKQLIDTLERTKLK